MKNFTKVLTVVLAVAMIFSSVAFAAFTDVKPDASYNEAVSVLASLEILKGYEDGSFKPDQTITRAEFAAVICRALGLENAANGAKGATAFTDVTQEWQTGYVNMAFQQGIIAGYGDNKFGPEDSVTFEQSVKMIVAALGYTPKANTLGGYPSGYLVVAAQEGITNGVSGTAGKPATRAVVTRMVYNALDVPMMEQTGFGTDVKYEAGDTMLLDKLNVTKVEGKISAMAFANTTGERDGYDDNEVMFSIAKQYKAVDGKLKTLVDGDVNFDIETLDPTVKVGKTDIKNYLEYVMVAYIADIDEDTATFLAVAPKSGRNATKEVVSWDANMDTTKTTITQAGAIGDVSFFTDKDNNKYQTFKLSTSIESPFVLYTNGCVKLTGAPAVTELYNIMNDSADDDYAQYADIKLLSTVTSGEYNVAFVTLYEDFVVDTTSTKSYKVTTKGTTGSVILDYTDEDYSIKFVKDGKAAKFEDIKEDDVLSITGNFDGDTLICGTVYIISSQVKGTLDEVFVDDGVAKISGKEYDYYMVDMLDIGLGNTATFFINQRGFIFMQDKVTNDLTNTNYGFVTKIGSSNDSFADGKVARMMTLSDGKWATYDFAEKIRIINGITGDEGSQVNTKDTTFNQASIFVPTTLISDNTFVNGLVTYELNTAGDIYKICFNPDTANADVDSVFDRKTIDDKSFNESLLSIGGVYLNEKTTKVLSIAGKTFSANINLSIAEIDEDDISLLTTTALKDDQAYSLFAYDLNDDNVAAVMMGFDIANAITADQPFFIVESKSSVLNADGDTVAKLNGFSNGKALSVVVSGDLGSADIDTTDVQAVNLLANFTIDDIVKGSVILYSVNAKDEASKIKVLFNAASNGLYNVNTLVNPFTYPAADGITLFSKNDVAGSDYDFVFGYAYSKSSSKLSFARTSTVNANTALTDYIVGTSTNVVTYDKYYANGPKVAAGDVSDIDTDKLGGGCFIFARASNSTLQEVVVIVPKD